MRTATTPPNRAYPPQSSTTSQSPGELPTQSTENQPNSPTKSPSRPPLQRKPASVSPPQRDDDPLLRPPQHHQRTQKHVDPADDQTSNREMLPDEGQRVPTSLKGKAKGHMDSSEAERLQRLKDQINEKMSYNQQRARVQPRTASVGLGGRRVSPIKEEGTAPGISPTLEGAFSSPLPTGAQTASTESTESARTIRGSVPQTPNTAPLHTPSYPFPYVGTPRVWSSAFHRPFTTLSPTVSAANIHDRGTPRSATHSELSTPTAAAIAFMPPDASPMPESDEARFPTPNLYDLSLELSLEPGLLSWWTAVSRIMSGDFGASRASLAMPADAGELENVPWGQKATFSMSGPPEVDHSLRRTEAMLRIPDFKSAQGPQTPAPLRNVHEEDRASRPGRGGRPVMTSRHSYAGYEKEKTDMAPAAPSARVERPKGPMRTKSHAPQGMARVSPEQPIRPPSPGGLAQTPGKSINFSDPDFSSIESVAPSGPFRTVLPTLRALNYESHALINSTYVNRIIERGKMVILTRDYSGDDSSRKGSLEETHKLQSSVGSSTGDPSNKAGLSNEPSRANEALRGGPKEKGKLSRDYFSRDKPFPAYDEYEQFPSSPWSQSPAPSPAIQTDQEENPFFSSGRVDEESFNPNETSPDYSKLTQVEAIGVDKASTVIHIPFMHPLLSQNLPSSMSDPEPNTPTGIHFGRLTRQYVGARSGARSGDDTPIKKAPIAILSIISPIVPYPHNLIHSLKLLALHMATSFANAHQYSSAHQQASAIHQRRMGAGHKMGFAPFSTDTEGLEYLAEADIDLSTGSTTGSITSPSDYSGRSRASPGGSLLGTPAWDPSVVFSSRQSTGGTPGGGEILDSYFDAKKKSTTVRSTTNTTSAHKGRGSPPLHTPVQNQFSEEEIDTPKLHQLRPRDTSQESLTGNSGSRGGAARGSLVSPRRPSVKAAQVVPIPDRNDRKRHSLLHSYGADFNSTFQGLSSTTAIGGRGSVSGPPQQSGEEEMQDMLPPSERLLRTIIDALPVQIFTAAPGSGSLTWVNSKFVAYRGREPHQIIQDPWAAIHPGDREHYMEQWQRSLGTGQPFAHKVRLQRFDDQYRWFFVRATPLKDKRQNIVHWTGTYMDIHEQHVAELSAARQQETAASEARYRALANSSPQIVFAATQNRGVVFCNSQWLLYAGQTEAQARALGFMDFVHPDDLVKCRLPTINEDGSFGVDAPTTVPMETRRTTSQELSDDSSETDRTVTSPGGTSPDTIPLPQKKLSELAGTGILKVSRDSDGRPSYTTEVRLRNKDGEYRWHLVRVLLSAPVREDDDEEEETWYGTCTDINDHKLLEQTLKETMDAKSRFLSNMSHEIRTPLNGITGMVNFLIDSHLTQEQLEHVHIIRNSTEGLRDLINDILDLSKVEAGMISLSHDWLHLRSLIEEINDLTSAMAVGKGLELNYLIEDDVPPMVKGDRFRLRQVLLNVVGNAIKFTQRGEVYVHCEVSNETPVDMESDEMMLRFHVTDTGSGFTEKEAEFLFKRFSQIDSSSTKQHGGTGLGLAISMQLVELHGGRMTATSVPSKGSTFTFSVKFHIPSAKDQPPDFPVALINTQDETVDRRLSSHIPRAAASYTPGLPPMPPSSTGTVSPTITSPIRYINESAASSGSSDPSIRTARTSLGSQRSSASSLAEVVFNKAQPISLELPQHLRGGRPITLEEASIPSSNESMETVRPSIETSKSRSLSPLSIPMYSILVVCPLALSRRATVKHIDTTIPKNLPNHITAPDSVDECKRMLGMLGRDEPVIFTHIVVMLHNISEIIALVDQALRSPAYSSTSILIITDFQQRKEIEEQAKEFDYKKLASDTIRIRWVYKPLKPSKFAVIFDPEKLRELSTDRSQDSAQAVVVSQKQVFEEMRRRLGNRGIRVLLVEDNKTNQMVLLKFLKRSEIEAESVFDGVQCTDKVFSQPPDYYSIILCDLHMPNKDGYQTCKDIRRWERKNKYKHLPIIALSANVLGDVYAKCVEAGFNSYVTKPVDFKELSVQLSKFLDPEIKGQEHEFMKKEGKQ